MSAPYSTGPRSQNRPPRNEKKGGCLKFLAIGCVIVLILGGLGGYWLFQKGKDWIENPGANIADLALTTFIEESELPQKEKDELLQVTQEFISDIKADKYEKKEIEAIIEAMMEQRVSAVLSLYVFDLSYIDEAGLDPKKISEAKRIMSRYREGFRSGKIVIGDSRFSEVNTIITDSKTTTKPDGTIHTEITYKEKITLAQLDKCLEIMKSVADASAIEDRQFKIDLAKMMRAAIARGSVNYKKKMAEEKASEIASPSEAPAPITP